MDRIMHKLIYNSIMEFGDTTNMHRNMEIFAVLLLTTSGLLLTLKQPDNEENYPTA